MAHAKVKVIGRRAQWATRFKVDTLHGKPLIVAGAIGTRYFDALDALIMRMRTEVEREFAALARTADVGDSSAWAMDASVASQARILANTMRDKFAKLFDEIAGPTAQKMVAGVTKDSEQKLGISLKEMSGQLVLKTDIFNDQLRDVLKATVTENVNLIKRVDDKYFDDIIGAVNRSIASGNGLADLQPALKEYGVKVRNWAKNVSLDQTRKAYNNVNRERMQALGVTQFMWVHSGGSNHPREYHRDQLDGKIFSFDDLPHLDGPGKGERGIPGQAPFCRCTMRPVWNFDDDDD